MSECVVVIVIVVVIVTARYATGAVGKPVGDAACTSEREGRLPPLFGRARATTAGRRVRNESESECVIVVVIVIVTT